MEKTLNDEEIAHSLNESLLKEAEEIKSERKLLKVRLEKLEETKSSTSDAVYQRVRGDYMNKLSQTAERLVALKKDLGEEERKIVEKKNLVEAHISLQKDAIEESQLRHALGEFSTEQHQELVQQKKAEVKRLEAALKGLSQGLERHQDIFAGEDLAEAKPVQKPPFSPPPKTKIEDEPSVTAENTAKIRLTSATTDQASPPKKEPTSPKPKVAELALFENGKVVQTIPIDKTIHIGRSPSNDIVLKGTKVSRRHAEVQCVAGKFVLLDLESSNGTYIGGKRISEHSLEMNDEIVIGGTKILFKMSESAKV